MDAKTLIDGIIRQTTVLIAQLSTSAGLRAPLAHVADQIFVDLAKEIEAQGVGRKVVADMFGLALRSYQKKVDRLTESVTHRERTLWEAVLEWLDEKGSATRGQVLTEFRHDEPPIVAAVLNDLVESGLLFSSGRGDLAVYRVTSQADRRKMYDRQHESSLQVWIAYELSQKARSSEELQTDLGLEEPQVDAALLTLVEQGLVSVDAEDSAKYRAEGYTVPVGAELGWETAVYDHVQAVMQAVIAKLVRGPKSSNQDVIGGATARFDLTENHPLRQETLNLLHKVRTDVAELWTRVEAENEKRNSSGEKQEALYFYFGQNLVEIEPSDEES